VTAVPEPLVSTVVVNYNGAHLLPACLDSLTRQDLPDHEVIVVDNGSIDDSAAVVDKHGCRFVPLGQNLGLPAAYNRGAEHARGEYVFFVNNDMRFDPACVRLLAEALGADATLFAADPLQFDWDGARVIHNRAVLQPVHSLRELLSRTILPWPPLAMSYIDSDAVVPVPWGCAGSLMIRRRMLADLGGWDDRLFIDMEDLDLCWRAWLRGWPTVYVPRARLYHKAGATNDEHLHPAKTEEIRRRLPSLNFRRLVTQQRNHFRFALKVLDFRSLAMLVAIKLTVLPIMAFRRPTVARAWVLALARAVAEIPEVWRLRRDIHRSRVCSSRDLITRFVTEGQAVVAAGRM
jgi:GT2 family glycosyltransferase